MKLLLSITLLSICLSACSCEGKIEIPEQVGDDVTSGTDRPSNNTDSVTNPVTIQYTKVIPDAYFSPAAHQGKVERITYASKDYTGSGATTRKPADVYLPYGYDPEGKYDVFYMLHGWGGVAEELLTNYSQTRNILDHMIQDGLMRPMIVVSPTWDKDDQPKGFGESVEEIAVFHNEFINELVPAVELKYATYLKSAGKTDIEASRDHRAFGGFSLGSVTTWWAFEHNLDYIRYFIPMSGSSWHMGTYGGANYPEETAAFLAELVSKNKYGKDGFFVYVGNGTNDAVYSQPHNQSVAMAALPETFNTGNFAYYMIDGGYHNIQAAWEHFYNALPLLFPPVQEETPVTQTYNRSSKIADVMADPSFGTFGRLLFPVNTGYYSGSTLGDLRLTWYNYIDPDKTVEIVNTLKSRAEAGLTIFYDIWSDAEKSASPDKRNTGLFFFQGEKGKPFAVCNAGGGMVYVGAMHDSFPHALELSKKGYNAFALIYRPGYDTAMEDLAQAVKFIRSHASELGVNPDGYSLWGGSAGARMAAYIGSYASRYGIPQPGAVIMQYTGYTDWTRSDPPTYANCGTSDGIASYRTMQSRLESMAGAGIPTEFHSYSGLPHGFGLGTGTIAEGWIDDAVKFWEKNIK